MMATITVNVDETVYQRFRRFAVEVKAGRKGYLGDTITEAMQMYVEEREQEAIAKRLISRIKKGVAIGYKGYSKRSDLYNERVKHIRSGGH